MVRESILWPGMKWKFLIPSYVDTPSFDTILTTFGTSEVRSLADSVILLWLNSLENLIVIKSSSHDVTADIDCEPW